MVPFMCSAWEDWNTVRVQGAVSQKATNFGFVIENLAILCYLFVIGLERIRNSVSYLLPYKGSASVNGLENALF